jgi:hypothetical protein
MAFDPKRLAMRVVFAVAVAFGTILLYLWLVTFVASVSGGAAPAYVAPLAELTSGVAVAMLTAAVTVKEL